MHKPILQLFLILYIFSLKITAFAIIQMFESCFVQPKSTPTILDMNVIFWFPLLSNGSLNCLQCVLCAQFHEIEQSGNSNIIKLRKTTLIVSWSFASRQEYTIGGFGIYRTKNTRNLQYRLICENAFVFASIYMHSFIFIVHNT